jgi:hypothetical protein
MFRNRCGSSSSAWPTNGPRSCAVLPMRVPLEQGGRRTILPGAMRGTLDEGAGRMKGERNRRRPGGNAQISAVGFSLHPPGGLVNAALCGIPCSFHPSGRRERITITAALASTVRLAVRRIVHSARGVVRCIVNSASGVAHAPGHGHSPLAHHQRLWRQGEPSIGNGHRPGVHGSPSCNTRRKAALRPRR